ncbi:MAG: MFS transporter [Phycisphaerae bacterium]
MLFSTLVRVFAPAPHRPRRPPDEVRRAYPWFRWSIIESTFLGYATFYLVRNNLSTVSKDLQAALHYNADMIGTITAVTALSYGVGKFLMGNLSDRSNPRTFMAFGLLLTAACNFAFGGTASYTAHLLLWTLNGFVQGMGWPPCGRSMGHWFAENERGLTFSIWNTSHNCGGAAAGVIAAYAANHFGGWQYAFFVPGVLALIGALYLLVRLRDTPQSVGLPPIEEYAGYRVGREQPAPSLERELTTRELFIDYVLKNPWIWLLAFANFFAYVSRYSLLDWAPKYLRDVKGATLTQGGWAIFWNETGGIPSTILLGWLSDRLGGRRGMVATVCLVPILVAFAVILFTPPGFLWLDYTMMAVVGLCIYPVINFIVIMALDLTSKKAIGTAAGFIGLLGYLGRMAQAKGFGWIVHHYEPTYGLAGAWRIVFWVILACTAMALLLMAMTWRVSVQRHSRGFPRAAAGNDEPSG